ncbi:MAG: hypothetical protein QM805_07805 [Pseudomonas sp.]
MQEITKQQGDMPDRHGYELRDGNGNVLFRGMIHMAKTRTEMWAYAIPEYQGQTIRSRRIFIYPNINSFDLFILFHREASTEVRTILKVLIEMGV